MCKTTPVKYQEGIRKQKKSILIIKIMKVKEKMKWTDNKSAMLVL